MLNAYNERKKQIDKQEIHTDAAETKSDTTGEKMITRQAGSLDDRQQAQDPWHHAGTRPAQDRSDTNTLPDRQEVRGMITASPTS